MQAVDDLANRLALGAERDPDQIEILHGNARDRGAVRLVVIRRKELLRVDDRCDATAHRTLESSPQRHRVGFVNKHRLDEHRQLFVPRRVPGPPCR